MAANISQAAKSGTIDDTLGYRKVARRLIDLVEQSEFEPVEAFAEENFAMMPDVLKSELFLPSLQAV